MTKLPYTQDPSAWDMARRENLSAARRAYAMEGPPTRKSRRLPRIAWGLAIAAGWIAMAFFRG